MQLQAWLEAKGAKGLAYLALEDFPETGRGVKTLRSLKAGDELLTIPGAVLWTADAAAADPLLGPVLRTLNPPLSIEETLAVFLLFVKSREAENEERTLHTKVLPVRYTATIFFEDDELEICAGSSLYGITKQLKQQVKEDFTQILGRLFIKHPELFPLNEFTLEEYTWALCTVWSRAMDFHLPGNKQLRLIAPFADMLNHSLDVKTCHIYDQQTNTLRVVAGKDYNAGDQVFINYGPVPNNRLLRLYGFVIPSNPNDSYDLVLTTHPLAALYAQKLALFAAADLDVTSTIPLTLMDPLPDKVLQYLRIQRLTDVELAVAARPAGAAGPVTARNEGEVLSALTEALTSLLEGFSISAEELGRRLDQGEYTPGGNAWAAAVVSMGEQHVLEAALRRAKERLALVACANCGKVMEGNKRCGKCKKVVYCGVKCQREHHKEHKVVCRPPQEEA